MSGPGSPALPPAGAPGDPCRECHTPLAGDQRYCLTCGARRGAGTAIDFASLLHGATPTERVRRRVTASRDAGPPAGRIGRTLRAPIPAATTMLLTLLLAGILLGSLTSSGTQARGQAQRISVTLPPSAADAAGALSSPIAPSATPPPVAAPAPIPAPSARAAVPPVAPPAADPTATDDPDGAAGDDDAAPASDDDPVPAALAAQAIGHVVVIRLGEPAVQHPFATTPANPFLATLVSEGTLLPHLRTVADSGIADAIALLSGQAPNPQTLAGCPLYGAVSPATIAADGQEEGEGCVYSLQTSTLPTQLEAKGLTWRAYVEDQAKGTTGVATSCRHPPLGAADPWREPRPGDAYVTARNPFVFFTAITESASCAKNVVDLAELDADLAKPAADVPSFAYVVPSACNDGRPLPCVAGAPSGPGAADAFLARVVPKIQASKAYADALVIVLFDRAFPAAAPAAVPEAERGRGAKVGALLLSPRVRKARRLGGRYDTYSLLAAIEDLFGLERLARAAAPEKRLGPDVFVGDQPG